MIDYPSKFQKKALILRVHSCALRARWDPQSFWHSFCLATKEKHPPLTSYAPRGHRRRRRVATSFFPHHRTISPFCNRAVADANAASSQFPSKLPFLKAENKFNRWILSTEPKAKGEKRRRRRTRTRKEGENNLETPKRTHFQKSLKCQVLASYEKHHHNCYNYCRGTGLQQQSVYFPLTIAPNQRREVEGNRGFANGICLIRLGAPLSVQKAAKEPH
jgi:hypothetical protein